MAFCLLLKHRANFCYSVPMVLSPPQRVGTGEGKTQRVTEFIYIGCQRAAVCCLAVT